MKFNQAKESVNPMDISTEIKNALVSLMVAEGGEVEYAVVDREHTSWNEDVQCFVSIPKRVSEALKPPALEKYIIFGFQGTNARTIAIVADLAQLKQNHT